MPLQLHSGVPFGVIDVIGQCLTVGFENENLVIKAGILKFHTATKRTYVMSDMQFSGRTVTGQYNLFFFMGMYFICL